jgi:hypothetical protein
MKVILVALATVVPFGFFIIAGIIACRLALGLPAGPSMLGLAESDWPGVARRLGQRIMLIPGLRLLCAGRGVEFTD